MALENGPLDPTSPTVRDAFLLQEVELTCCAIYLMNY